MRTKATPACAAGARRILAGDVVAGVVQLVTERERLDGRGADLARDGEDPSGVDLEPPDWSLQAPKQFGHEAPRTLFVRGVRLPDIWRARRAQSDVIEEIDAGSHWRWQSSLLFGGAMGQPELFAQRTFAEQTERITRGAAGWLDPPEIRLEKLQSDGVLVIHRPDLLEHLAAPWPAAQAHSEVMLELKLPGNHLDRSEVERALLRRQARQVQRVEEQGISWLGEEPLWLVAPYVPRWLEKLRSPVCFAPGCYWVDPSGAALCGSRRTSCHSTTS